MNSLYRGLVLLLVLAVLLPLNSSQQDDSTTQQPLPFDWPVSTPQAQGIDPGIVDRVMRISERIPYIYGLLIARNGYLIAERYFHFYTQNDEQKIQSVSKSILAAIVGQAIENGFISGLDQKIMDFFPDYAPITVDQRFFDVTVAHLLTMTSGLPPSESPRGVRNPYELSFFSAENQVRYIFEHPLENNPGEVYNYSNTGTHLLSVITARATGMTTREFAEQSLFAPLGITVRQWNRDKQGYHYGGFGMYFAPRDLARFGQFYLQGGNASGVQILSRDYISDSISPHSETGMFRYGYLWRLFDILDCDIYFAWGYGGQFILNIPKLDMVIVTVSDPHPIRLDSGYHSDRVFKLMIHQILFPIISALGDHPYSPKDTRARKIENRSLVQRQYFNLINWAPNPLNSTGVEITHYRIYQLEHRIVDLSNDEWQFLGEVGAGTHRFLHFGEEEDQIYHYAVTAVTADGRESIPSVCTCQYPSN